MANVKKELLYKTHRNSFLDKSFEHNIWERLTKLHAFLSFKKFLTSYRKIKTKPNYVKLEENERMREA